MSDNLYFYKKLDVFDKFEAKIKEPKTVPNQIRKCKRNIRLFYENEPLLCDVMPIIEKQEKSNNIYPKLIKNIANSNSKFLKLIYDKIYDITAKDIQKDNSEIINKTNYICYYKLPKIDYLKLKLKKKDSENKIFKKIKIIKLNDKNSKDFRKSKIPFNILDKTFKPKSIRKLFFPSTCNKSNKIKLSYEENIPKMHNMRKNVSFNQDFSFSPSGTRINTESKKDSSINYSRKNESNINFSQYEKNNNSLIESNYTKSMDIIQKCESGVNLGSYFHKHITKYKNKLDKVILEKMKAGEYLNFVHKIIKEKKEQNNKYEEIEEKKLETIKKTKIEKISNHLAYERRKEFYKVLKHEKSEAYDIRRVEVRKENEELEKKKIIERKIIKKALRMAETGLKESIIMNKKIDEIIAKNRKIKILNKKMKFENQKITSFEDQFKIAKENLISSFNKIRKKEIVDFE